MTPFSQFSAGIPQSQFDFFSAVTAKAFASAERVIALNLSTSRASVERSSNNIKQLLQLNDPRDLLSLTSQPQQELQSLLAYSRELLSIVADVGLKLPAAGASAFTLPAPAAAPVARVAAVQPAPQPAKAAPQPVQAAPQPAPSSSVAGDAIAEQLAKASKAPVVVAVPAQAVEPVAEQVAEAKPVAKALSKVAPKPVEHPLAAPVAAQHEIELPQVKPVEAAPPPAPVSGTPAIDVRQAEAARSRNARKK
jgi:hypothetical protein